MNHSQKWIFTSILLTGFSMPSHNLFAMVAINDMNDYQSLVEKNPAVVLMVSTPTCVYCQNVKPAFEDLSVDDNLRHITFAMTTDAYDSSMKPLVEKYAIRGAPTFLYLKNGQEVHRTVGGGSHEQFKKNAVENIKTYLTSGIDNSVTTQTTEKQDTEPVQGSLLSSITKFFSSILHLINKVIRAIITTITSWF